MNQGQYWESDERLNWEYGDLRLRALKYVHGAGGSMQAVSLRGHLMLDVTVTKLLAAQDPKGQLRRLPFSGKIKTASKFGLIPDEIKALLADIARIRNEHTHELEAHHTFRHVHSLWVRARAAGIEHRFFSHHEEAWVTRNIGEMAELADELFDPATEMATLCVEVFAHLVFWNYDHFNLAELNKNLDSSNF